VVLIRNEFSEWLRFIPSEDTLSVGLLDLIGCKVDLLLIAKFLLVGDGVLSLCVEIPLDPEGVG
jgi:hypothetical protein